MGDFPGLSGWAHIITGVFMRGRQEDLSHREKIQGWKQKSEEKEDATLLALRRRRAHAARNAGRL